jgi:8-oxo-dGTP pyrophosphatase MutT (NUDIX family)
VASIASSTNTTALPSSPSTANHIWLVE